jgi:penicillin-binding protein 1C
VKTGTSKDMRDNWCIGFTDRYTVGVWVGNFSGAPMWDVSGTTGAAPVWAEIVGWLHRGSPSRPPAPPPGVVAARVAFDDGLEPARNEWFRRGTELAQVRRVDPQQAPLALVAPLDRSLYALDPDIPAGNQRITFEARGAQAAHAHWRLDGRVLGRGAQLRWAPMPGRHVLELVREGQIVERVHFEVRGATLKAAARAAPARDSPACPPRLCSPIGGNTS